MTFPDFGCLTLGWNDFPSQLPSQHDAALAGVGNHVVETDLEDITRGLIYI